SDSVIHATSPAAAHTGPIAVATSNGVGVSDNLFYVTPQIRNFSPRQAPVGYVINIVGHNFTSATHLDFHGAVATFTIISDSTMFAPVPAGATDGQLTIVAPGGSATSDSTFHVGPLPLLS